jgi:acid stress-induced BolA-like protein IbaG/YrbA
MPSFAQRRGRCILSGGIHQRLPTMTTDEIKGLIEQAIPNARVSVTGDGCNCEATVISEAFEGLNTLKRHQMIYAPINPYIADGTVHALAIKSFTPAEWEAKAAD